MRFLGYEKRLTNRGDREEIHAVFEIGRMANPFGEGDRPLSICYQKTGLEQRIAANKEKDDRLVMIDVLHNWPDEA